MRRGKLNAAWHAWPTGTTAPEIGGSPQCCNASFGGRRLLEAAAGLLGKAAQLSFLCVSRTFIQGLVNVPIQHHPTIGDIISNRYWKVMFKISTKGHLPTSVARAKSPTSSG